jgi:glycosyltransferase involved in cell wall biosynthesis
MKKIVFDGRELRTSSGRYVERLLHYIQEIDDEHLYDVLLKPKDFEGWKPTNSKFSKIVADHKEFTFDEQLGFLSQIKKIKPDLVHFPFPQQPIFYRRPVITTIHDLTTLRFDNPDKNKFVFKIKQRIYKYVIKRAAHKSKHLLTGSEYVKHDIIQLTGVSPEKITVTYEAADAVVDSPEELPTLKDKQFIMYIGRPTPHKNLERLIEAFVQLKALHPNLMLVLAGKKDANYIRIENIVKYKRIENIIFTDFVSEGQLRWLYEKCEAYVFPSLSEGFGLPGLEAMVHGAPVVSSNATCLPEIYGDGAHYFDPLYTEEMADAINEVLTNKDLRTELIHKGRDQAARYSWQRTAEQTLEVYRKVLGA